MSTLTENPDLMLEALAALVKRLGGTVTITADEAPGEFNLLSKFEEGKLHLVLDYMDPLSNPEYHILTEGGEG